MSNFFRKTSVKIVAAILCIIFLTFAVLSGTMVLRMLSAGAYFGEADLFETFAKDTMAVDASSIMMDYFDPQAPSQPWKSYYDGGIYTGENSNYRYNITDDKTGYSVLSTIKGGEPIRLKTTHTYSFDLETPIAQSDDYVLSDTMFRIGSTLYGYDKGDNCFYPVYEGDNTSMATGVTELPSLVYDAGFSYISGGGNYVYTEGGSYELQLNNHFTYDGYGFSYTEETVEYSITTKYYTITSYLLNDLSARDNYRVMNDICSFLTLHRTDLAVLLAVSLVLGLALLVVLCLNAGLVPNQEEPRLSFLFRVPTDLAFFCTAVVFCCGVACCGELYYNGMFGRWINIVALSVCSLLLPISLVYGLMMLSARGRAHRILSGSFIGWCWRKLRGAIHLCKALTAKALCYLPMLWKVAVCYLVICFIEFIFLMTFSYGIDGTLVFFWFVEKLILGALVGYVTLCFRRLKKGAEAIAAGDYTTRVEEEHLVLDFKDTANTLNHIQGGMNAAVESRMKSERLKTELITNVSHDIKTPLTSIISYVDLLKKEPAGSSAAGEYLEVLDRQSARLKKLVEDLVEASKASTGNITVHAETMDLGVILGQALGEYNERLLNADLTPVLKLPETPVTVSADGRLLWRIFDNLLGNAVKYAMPGTRIYVTLTADTHAIVTFRNVSREALDISADELMERFVRGDASRHTEGSGLGLSIAKSLAESMGGQFLLNVDGDLFKAAVIFPVIPSQN